MASTSEFYARAEVYELTDVYPDNEHQSLLEYIALIARRAVASVSLDHKVRRYEEISDLLRFISLNPKLSLKDIIPADGEIIGKVDSGEGPIFLHLGNTYRRNAA